MALHVDLHGSDLGCDRSLTQKFVEGYAADSSRTDGALKPYHGPIARIRSTSIFKLDRTLNVGNRDFMDIERQIVDSQILPCPRSGYRVGLKQNGSLDPGRKLQANRSYIRA